MSIGFRRLAPVFVSAFLLCAGRARAQDSAADTAAAKQHYERGTSFYDLGRYDDAIKEFEAAYELKKDAAILFNLAQAHRLAGSNDRALALYRTYVRNWPKGPNRAEAEKEIKALELKLATTAPPPAGTSPAPPTTPPPENTTTAPPANTAPPAPPNTPPPGTEPPVPVPPASTTPPPDYAPPPASTPSPPAYPPATTTTTDPGRTFRIAGIATAGAGAVMMVLGIVEWRRAVSASTAVEDAARNGDSFDPDVQNRGHSAETMQWVFYGVGALAAAGGVGLWLYGQKLTASAETTTWRVSLAPTLAPNQGGATLRVSF